MEIERIILADQIAYRSESLNHKVVIDSRDFKIRVVALMAGQELKPHTAPVNAFVTILEGEALIRIGDKSIQLKAGESAQLPADILHSLRAEKNFKMMLVR